MQPLTAVTGTKRRIYGRPRLPWSRSGHAARDVIDPKPTLSVTETRVASRQQSLDDDPFDPPTAPCAWLCVPLLRPAVSDDRDERKRAPDKAGVKCAVKAMAQPRRELTGRARDRRFGKVRAKVEHLFRVMKCQLATARCAIAASPRMERKCSTPSLYLSD